MIELSLRAIAALVVAVIAIVIGILWLRRRREDDEEPLAPPVVERTPTTEAELAKLLQSGGNDKVRITGELRVSGNTVLPSGFVMDGSLTLLEGARLDSLVEVRGNATLEANAEILRPLLVRGDLTLGRNARVPACHVEGAVHLHPGAVVGSLLECGTLFVHEGAAAPARAAMARTEASDAVLP